MYKIAVIASVSVLAAVSAAQSLTLMSENRAEARPLVAMAVAPAAASGRTASIAKAADGHYWAEAKVDGSRVKFLVDTGATTVALRAEDARRLGFSTGDLDYSYEVMTAVGPALAARINLPSVSVDGAKVDNVEAYVIENGLETPLLGMSYLGRLSGFEATPSSLILHP